MSDPQRGADVDREEKRFSVSVGRLKRKQRVFSGRRASSSPAEKLRELEDEAPGGTTSLPSSAPRRSEWQSQAHKGIGAGDQSRVMGSWFGKSSLLVGGLVKTLSSGNKKLT